MNVTYPGGKGSEVLVLGGCCRGLAPSVTVLVPEAASAAALEDEAAAAATTAWLGADEEEEEASVLGWVLEDTTADWCGEDVEAEGRVEAGSFSSSVPPAGGSTSSSGAASAEFSPLTAERREGKV